MGKGSGWQEPGEANVRVGSNYGISAKVVPPTLHVGVKIGLYLKLDMLSLEFGRAAGVTADIAYLD